MKPSKANAAMVVAWTQGYPPTGPVRYEEGFYVVPTSYADFGVYFHSPARVEIDDPVREVALYYKTSRFRLPRRATTIDKTAARLGRQSHFRGGQ